MVSLINRYVGIMLCVMVSSSTVHAGSSSTGKLCATGRCKVADNFHQMGLDEMGLAEEDNHHKQAEHLDFEEEEFVNNHPLPSPSRSQTKQSINYFKRAHCLKKIKRTCNCRRLLRHKNNKCCRYSQST